MSEVVSKERTYNYLRQVKSAVGYRAVAMVASFLVVPLMIHYLGQEQFGVWSTLLTILSWVTFFDLGVGNGLRNKVAESLAKGETREAGSYVASSYSLIGMIALALWIVVSAGSYFVSWQDVFNTQEISENILSEAVRIAAFFILLNFWVGLIGALLGAVQKTSLVALGQMITNLLVLTFTFALTKITEPSITNLALVYGISIVIANILLSLWFYNSRPELRPRIYLDKNHMRSILTIGLQFFSIQLAALVIFTTDRMLITQLFGPEYVTEYEVVFKLFSVITFVHGLISAPLWSAYTDAYHRKDFSWIKRTLRIQLFIFVAISAAVFVTALLANTLISLWIGEAFQASSSLIIGFALLAILSVWNNVFGSILGGIGKIRLGSIYTIFTAILNLPISYYFSVVLEYGLAGVIFGTIASITISSILSPIQVYFFIYKKSTNHTLYSMLR